jgi:hypothetical protein
MQRIEGRGALADRRRHAVCSMHILQGPGLGRRKREAGFRDLIQGVIAMLTWCLIIDLLWWLR